MKNSIIYSVVLFSFVCLSACSPKVTTTLIKAKAPLEPGEEVTVLQPEQSQPEDAVVLETLRMQGNDYGELVTLAEEKARTSGGNILKIAQHFEPDITSPRHRVSALVLSADESDSTITSSGRVVPEFIESELDLRKESWSVRIALQGGGAYRFGKDVAGVEEVVTAHNNNRRWGPTYGADVSFFFSDYFGVGLKAQNVYYADKMPASATDKYGRVKNGYLEDYENIWFAGVVFSSRLPSKNRNNAFLARAGYGIAGYSDWGQTIVPPSYTISGTAPALLLELGYDFGIAKNLSVGAALTFIRGAMKNASVITSDGRAASITADSDNAESLSSLSLSIGLRYNL